MNISQAKEQIKNAMIAYFTKDDFGGYAIPIEKQRPVFMMGPPGIGKTAIMEQVAAELGVGLVSYSMSHHTRQSALGLPFISKKVYGGVEYDISEYTMSEIIATVYDMIETTGHKEGILFLDEINCVSETLAPAMLQFLQYKIFGRHTVPAGWIIVTAGNPPEYNNSVREFDIVTWDRLKRVDVEPDFGVWKEFALKKGVHPAITTYLDIKKDHFYRIETTVDGKSFVTARGWTDLSDMIRLYEKNNLPVDLILIAQYLQNDKIAKSFAVYYDLFKKYQSDYKVDTILAGNAPAEIKRRAREAKFDERLSLIGLLFDKLFAEAQSVIYTQKTMTELLTELRPLCQPGNSSHAERLERIIAKKRELLQAGIKASNLSTERKYVLLKTVERLESLRMKLAVSAKTSGTVADFIKNAYNEDLAAFKEQVALYQSMLEHAFAFLDEVFGDGQEILIFVTELTTSYYCASCINTYGCPAYFKHNKELQFFERQKEIASTLSDLGWDTDGEA